jgi:prepilin-type N-terminal cleavage/methylation domain-containing protein|tara:strand:- start:382 stop:849 length:468 start_codon:yes stop_codon:yes gene_type:complete
MLLKKIKSNAGVTMVELVIVLAIMGILSVTVIPMYSQMQAKSQATRNRANMEIIKDAFLNHFYHTYSMGTPSVPTPPDSLMTDEWCNSPMDSTRGTKTPNDLFGSGEVPKNSNNVPFLYRSWIETKSDGRQDRIIMIKDTDPDSPSYGEDETVII